MAHLHEMRDSDNHFIIDPATMVITNKSKKHKLQQGDHNSEIYSFEIPRRLEGHDMTLCNLVQIHYINIKADKTEQQSDVYNVTDMVVCDPEADTLVFTWTVHGNATKFDGTLSFRIHFYCIDDHGEYTYKKHTEIFKGISISEGFDNAAAIENDNSDILSQWESRLDALEQGNINTADHSMYFDIDVDGLVSLKPEYRGLGEITTVKDENDNTIYDDYGNPVYRYPYSHSDNGLGIVGSKYAELPENLVIPDVINDIAVAAFVNGMLSENHRIKSLTIPAGVTSLSEKFASKTINLVELYGTENIEVIYGAAFQYSAIKKAIFPKLKELNAGGYQFNQCANLSVVDIGNTVTKIAKNCFAYCDRLSLIRGGASVTGIEAKAFFGTRSLKNLPLVEKVKTIQTEAFVLSRVSNIGSGYSDWWAFYDAKVCSFNTNATPAIFNKSKWWEIEGYTPTACKNSLGSTFDQINPEWAELQLPTDSGVCKDKWGDACLETSAIHIYSALTGRKFNTPMEFMELLRGKTDNQGSLLTPVKTAEGNPDYSWGDMTRWFAALSDDEVSFETERLVHNAESFQKICVALAEGALVLTHINPRHAAVIYGVAENGEMLLLDSNGRNGYLGDHTARTYQQPIWSFALKNDDVIIVKKSGGQ